MKGPIHGKRRGTQRLTANTEQRFADKICRLLDSINASSHMPLVKQFLCSISKRSFIHSSCIITPLIEGKKMKGFIHVMEIVIVALTIFVVIALFAYIPKIETDWTKTKLMVYGNDLIFSLDKEGVNWLNKTQVADLVSRVLPANLEFDLEVKNAIKPDISIGCVCSPNMIDIFQEFLNDFEFNGVNTSFRVEWINPSEISFPVTFDLILFLDNNIPDEKRYELESYLGHDKGLIEISGLDTNIIGYPIYRNIFNLGWIDESIPLTGYDAEFQETEIGKVNYKIKKYFYHTPFRILLAPDIPPQGVTSCIGKYASGWLDFRENNYKVWVIDNTTAIPGSCDLALYIDINNNNNLNEPAEGSYSAGDAFQLDGYNFMIREIGWDYSDIIFQEAPEYNFRFSNLEETIYPGDNASEKIVLQMPEIYSDGRSVPVSVVNYNMINGKGRAVWLSNSSISELKSDTKQLIKNLIIWAAGEEYKIIKGAERANPITLYFYKTLNKDMFQPIELTLTLGYK